MQWRFCQCFLVLAIISAILCDDPRSKRDLKLLKSLLGKYLEQIQDPPAMDAIQPVVKVVKAPVSKITTATAPGLPAPHEKVTLKSTPRVNLIDSYLGTKPEETSRALANAYNLFETGILAKREKEFHSKLVPVSHSCGSSDAVLLPHPPCFRNVPPLEANLRPSALVGNTPLQAPIMQQYARLPGYSPMQGQFISPHGNIIEGTRVLQEPLPGLNVFDTVRPLPAPVPPLSPFLGLLKGYILIQPQDMLSMNLVNNVRPLSMLEMVHEGRYSPMQTMIPSYLNLPGPLPDVAMQQHINTIEKYSLLGDPNIPQHINILEKMRPLQLTENIKTINVPEAPPNLNIVEKLRHSPGPFISEHVKIDKALTNPGLVTPHVTVVENYRPIPGPALPPRVNVVEIIRPSSVPVIPQNIDIVKTVRPMPELITENQVNVEEKTITSLPGQAIPQKVDVIETIRPLPGSVIPQHVNLVEQFRPLPESAMPQQVKIVETVKYPLQMPNAFKPLQMPLKYSYKQTNQDGTMTTYESNDQREVVVSKTVKPNPGLVIPQHVNIVESIRPVGTPVGQHINVLENIRPFSGTTIPQDVNVVDTIVPEHNVIPTIPKKYSHIQTNQDGSITTYKSHGQSEVVVSKTVKPNPAVVLPQHVNIVESFRPIGSPIGQHVQVVENIKPFPDTAIPQDVNVVNTIVPLPEHNVIHKIPNKYFYKQTNQDGSITTYESNGQSEVVVSKIMKPHLGVVLPQHVNIVESFRPVGSPVGQHVEVVENIRPFPGIAIPQDVNVVDTLGSPIGQHVKVVENIKLFPGTALPQDLNVVDTIVSSPELNVLHKIPNKYSYQQTNQDGSVTTYETDEKSDVVVSKTVKSHPGIVIPQHVNVVESIRPVESPILQHVDIVENVRHFPEKALPQHVHVVEEDKPLTESSVVVESIKPLPEANYVLPHINVINNNNALPTKYTYKQSNTGELVTTYQTNHQNEVVISKTVTGEVYPQPSNNDQNVHSNSNSSFSSKSYSVTASVPEANINTANSLYINQVDHGHNLDEIYSIEQNLDISSSKTISTQDSHYKDNNEKVAAAIYSVTLPKASLDKTSPVNFVNSNIQPNGAYAFSTVNAATTNQSNNNSNVKSSFVSQGNSTIHKQNNYSDNVVSKPSVIFPKPITTKFEYKQIDHENSKNLSITKIENTIPNLNENILPDQNEPKPVTEMSNDVLNYIFSSPLPADSEIQDNTESNSKKPLKNSLIFPKPIASIVNKQVHHGSSNPLSVAKTDKKPSPNVESSVSKDQTIPNISDELLNDIFSSPLPADSSTQVNTKSNSNKALKTSHVFPKPITSIFNKQIHKNSSQNSPEQPVASSENKAREIDYTSDKSVTKISDELNNIFSSPLETDDTQRNTGSNAMIYEVKDKELFTNRDGSVNLNKNKDLTTAKVSSNWSGSPIVVLPEVSHKFSHKQTHSDGSVIKMEGTNDELIVDITKTHNRGDIPE